jgi:hypothetical protein
LYTYLHVIFTNKIKRERLTMKKMLLIGFLAAILIIPGTNAIVGAQEDIISYPPEGRDPEVVAAASEAAAAAESRTNLTYYAIQPCRIIDTRLIGPPIPGSTALDFLVTDTISPTPGQPNCGIPFGPAKAVAVNIAATQAAGPGNLRAYAYPDPLPYAAFMNYGIIPGLTALSNYGIVNICDVAVAGCVWDMRVWVSTNTHFIVDAFGYFQ